MLSIFHFLTAEQLTRLLYAAGSLTYTKARLKRLVDVAFCERYKQPRRTERGNLPYIYRLSRRGVAFVVDALGVEPVSRIRPARVGEYTYLRYEHLIRLNDLLIALTLVCRDHPQMTLAALRHDEDLRRTPIPVTLADGIVARVVPDAWVDIRIADGTAQYQECFAIELDRGTEHKTAWQAKVASLVAFANGPYQQTFGTQALTFAVATTAGTQRTQQLVSWTAAELTRLGRLDLTDRFQFSELDAATVAPAALLLAPIWSQPFASGRTPLIVVEGRR